MATREQLSGQKIDKLIVEVRNSTMSFYDKVQEAAIAIIDHASLYGDCSRAKHLARAVPAKMRNQLIGYFRLFSPIGVSIGKTAADDKNRFVSDDALANFRKNARLEGADGKPIDTSKWQKFHMAGAKLYKWHDDPARVAPDPKPLDGTKEVWDRIEGFLERLMKDAEKADEKAKFAEEDRPVIQQMIKDLQQMVNRYHVRQAEKLASNEAGTTHEEEGVTGGNVVAGPKPRRQRSQATKAASAAVH